MAFIQYPFSIGTNSKMLGSIDAAYLGVLSNDISTYRSRLEGVQNQGTKAFRTCLRTFGKLWWLKYSVAYGHKVFAVDLIVKNHLRECRKAKELLDVKGSPTKPEIISVSSTAGSYYLVIPTMTSKKIGARNILQVCDVL